MQMRKSNRYLQRKVKTLKYCSEAKFPEYRTSIPIKELGFYLILLYFLRHAIMIISDNEATKEKIQSAPVKKGAV